MQLILVFLLKIFILSAIFAGSAFGLNTSSYLATCTVFVVSGILVVSSLMFGLRASKLLGFVALLIPALGPGAVQVATAAFLFGQAFGSLFDEHKRKDDENYSRELLILSGASFSTAMLATAFIPFYLDTDWYLLKEILKIAGVSGLSRVWAADLYSGAAALRLLNGYLLMVLMILALAAERNVKQTLARFFTGAAYSIFVSLPIFIYQLKHSGSIDIAKMTKQFSVLASSPEALGAALAILSPVLLTLLKRRIIFQPLLFISILTLGVFSGSRSFYLGLFVTVLLTAWLLVNRFKRIELNIAFAVGVLGLLSVIVMLGHPQINNNLQNSSLRPLAKALNWEEPDGVFSRGAVFSRLALNAWRESPVLGIGLDRLSSTRRALFAEAGLEGSSSYLKSGGNFYLQLLAEGGLFAMSLFLLAVSLLIMILANPFTDEEAENETYSYPSVPVQRAARVALGVFIVLLFTGTIFVLPEIQLIMAFIIVTACIRPVLVRKLVLAQVRVGTTSALFLFAFGFVVLAGIKFEPQKTKGFYPKEPGTSYRWSGGAGRIVLCNNTKDTIQFRIKAQRPQIERYPVTVKLFEGRVDNGDATQNFELTNNEWVSVIVPLRPDAENKFSNAEVTFEVGPLYSPKVSQTGEDPRYLGVLVDMPEGAC